MSILKNHISGLIKPMSQPAMFVGIHKDTIKTHPTNRSMIRLKVLKGKKRIMKKAVMRLFEDYDIPRDWLYAYPGGIDNAMMNPDNTMFICGVRNQCHRDLMDDHRKLQMQIQEVEFDRDKFRQERDDFKEKLEEIQNRIAMK